LLCILLISDALDYTVIYFRTAAMQHLTPEIELTEYSNGRKLYKSMVRPHLEYAHSVWCPYKMGDIKEIEKVQKEQLNS